MAAAVFIPPSPHDSFPTMAATSRRAPLANIPNATNSPHRVLTASGSKRSRTTASISHLENEPPQKRQAIERPGDLAGPATPRQPAQPAGAEGRVFERGNGDGGPNAFQRRLVAARDKTVHAKVSKTVDNNQKEIETIQQWQKHYRKLFPRFKFYFDSVPDDMRSRFVRQINHLGAQEEKFFSKNVTHIVTTRQIPSETSRKFDSRSTRNETDLDENSQTINPSLLDKSSGMRTFGQNAGSMRRDGPNNNDILTRGRQMDMKIWAAEKLQRMLASLNEDTSGQATGTRHTHVHRGQDDLSQVLKNEKIGVAAEREQVSMPREMVVFRGPFIYIHDMDEKIKPIMVREYSRVARRQDGEWPQFRSATVGKCPFVEDPATRRELEQERQKQKALLLQQQQHEARRVSHTRTVSTEDTTTTMEPPRRTSPRKVLQDVRNPRGPSVSVAPMAKPPCKPERQSSFPPMPEQPPVEFVRPSQMHLAREPAASGIQKSNMTSAIQSQMISSAAATGLKAGTSKEVNELKRKVLERTHTGSLSVGSIPSSHRMNDLAGALKTSRATAPQRAAKSKAQEKLGGIQEEEDPYAEDLSAERAARPTAKKRKPAKRDPKPGYCENCRDKYDDFEEHVVSRKHRKFAMTQSNWEELDTLLRKLQAP